MFGGVAEGVRLNKKGMLVQKTTIGLDIGHSMVKAVALSANGKNVVRFPSVVSPAIDISDESAASSAQLETVLVNGRAYFTGATAISQGAANSVTGLSQNWVGSTEHAALFLSALHRLKQTGVPGVDDALLLLGLPSEYFKTQRDVLRDRAAEHFAGEVIVQPQPAGPYYGVMFNTDGSIASGRSMANESWAVIDVGHFTSDFLLVIRGERIEVGLKSVSGVHLAVDHLRSLVRDRGIDIDDLEAGEALSTRKIRNYGRFEDISQEVEQAVNLVVSRILDKAETVIAGHARKLDGVILAGGGGELIFPEIKAKWPHAVVSPDPRMAIADGFSRYGRMLLRARHQASLVGRG